MSDASRPNMLRRMAQRAAAPGQPPWRPSQVGTQAEDRALLREMIERKRRNDLVRKRELDMLRRVRHEGLTPDQAAALDAPISVPGELDPAPVADGSRMRAKIDEIELAMVGVPGGGAQRAPRLTRPVRLEGPSTVHAYVEAQATLVMPSTVVTAGPGQQPTEIPAPDAADMRHDPVLDVAVMAFAGGDAAAAERELQTLVKGACVDDADTWLVLADLYRATGQRTPFEALAMAFSRSFDRSPPQWFSLPALAAADLAARGTVTVVPGSPVWVAPARLDAADVDTLRSHCAQHLSPWVMDWGALRHLTPAGAQKLVQLAHAWGANEATLHWRGVAPLLAALQIATPTGQRNVPPVLWLARLAVLRLAHRPQAFEVVAIDYCVTYEVSPPSWEPLRCRVHADSEQSDATTAVLTEPPTSGFSEVPLPDEVVLPMVGDWVGDVSGTLAGWTSVVEATPRARIVLCAALLTRIDFTAAGDVLNWVAASRTKGRDLRFTDLHRLTALMLSVMGLQDHAPLFMRRT